VRINHSLSGLTASVAAQREGKRLTTKPSPLAPATSVHARVRACAGMHEFADRSKGRERSGSNLKGGRDGEGEGGRGVHFDGEPRQTPTHQQLRISCAVRVVLAQGRRGPLKAVQLVGPRRNGDSDEASRLHGPCAIALQGWTATALANSGAGEHPCRVRCDRRDSPGLGRGQAP
jgi:hypothetical protein